MDELHLLEAPLGAAELGKLRWRCRRGLLENDLFIERFFANHAHQITPRVAHGVEALMELADNDLLDLLLRRREPEGPLALPQVREVLELMRRPARVSI
jgi:antitoxin CptB